MWTVKVRREERGAKVEVRLKEKIPGVFWPVHQAIRRGEVTEVVAKGGRGSGKSSYLSMELVWQLLRHPDCHAVVLRKVGEMCIRDRYKDHAVEGTFFHGFSIP